MPKNKKEEVVPDPTLVKVTAMRVRNGWIVTRQYSNDIVMDEAVLGTSYDHLLQELSGETPPQESSQEVVELPEEEPEVPEPPTEADNPSGDDEVELL